MQRILIVDAERSFTTKIADRLRRVNAYKVAVLQEIFAASLMMASDRPDLVALDLGLLDASGIELLAWMRARLDLASVPVALLVAGGLDPQSCSRALQNPNVGIILNKRWDPGTIRDLLVNALAPRPPKPPPPPHLPAVPRRFVAQRFPTAVGP